MKIGLAPLDLGKQLCFFSSNFFSLNQKKKSKSILLKLKSGEKDSKAKQNGERLEEDRHQIWGVGACDKIVEVKRKNSSV